MNSNPLEQLIDLMAERLKLSESDRRELLAFKEKSMAEAEKWITGKKLANEEELARFKSEAWDIPYMNLFGVAIPDEVFELLPLESVENYKMICFEQKGEVIRVGMVNPEDYQAIEALDFLAKKLKRDVEIYIVSAHSFDAALREYRTLDEEVDTVIENAEEKLETRFAVDKETPQELESVLKEAPITKILSVIIRHAVEGRASDIHIEPIHKKTRVRYRIDGILRPALFLPRYIHPSLVARVKVMANLKLDETRIPQDGRIRIAVNGKDVDFRVSTLPLYEYEKVVMRILENSNRVPSLHDLGFPERLIRVIEEHMRRPHGMVLASGPTGSGKSTTLYSVLNMLNQEGVNIVTLEDPVEYYIDGINQSQVHGEVNYSFASGLRSILRQDPNIIMVGEIRDKETAKMAVNAGLTGHLLFSTVHTNNAVGAVPRLIDMGVEPFLISSTLSLVLSQRLMRKLCTHCRRSAQIPADLQARLEHDLFTLPETIKKEYAPVISRFEVYDAKGCTMCADTGYLGRLAVAEAIQITEEMKKIIYDGFEMEAVKRELVRQEMVSIRQEAILSLLSGVTSLEEVLRISEEEV